MPNWCSNELIIEGTYNQIKDVENYLAIESGYWDFNKIMHTADLPGQVSIAGRLNE